MAGWLFKMSITERGLCVIGHEDESLNLSGPLEGGMKGKNKLTTKNFKESWK